MKHSKEKKFFTNDPVFIGFTVLFCGIIGLSIFACVNKLYAGFVIIVPLFFGLIFYLLYSGTEYIYFRESTYVYRKNVFCKEVEIGYDFIDTVFIDFGSGAYKGSKRPLSNPGKVVCFEKRGKLANGAIMTYGFVAEVVKNFNSKQIKVNVDINAKVFGFPKKYHKLLYPYLSKIDKEKFIARYGIEYTESLNQNTNQHET